MEKSLKLYFLFKNPPQRRAKNRVGLGGKEKQTEKNEVYYLS